MHSAPIYFQFAERRAAYQAMDTLHELGFRANWIDHAHPEHKPTLQVYIEKNDLTSALEITQSFGGTLLDTDEGASEAQTFTSAYELNGIPIPAHLVNEDLPEAYMAPSDNGNDGASQGAAYGGGYDGASQGEAYGSGYDGAYQGTTTGGGYDGAYQGAASGVGYDEAYQGTATGGGYDEAYQGTTSDNSDDKPFDPSDDDYSQFSAGIHM